MSITGLGEIADLARTTIAAIWPDKTEQEKAQLAAAVSLVQGQLAINQAEAGSSSIFVAGWRPFIGWTCGAACAWNWMGLSIVNVTLQIVGHPLVLKPLDLSEMWPVLVGMLGIGGLRTIEKVKGVAS